MLYGFYKDAWMNGVINESDIQVAVSKEYITQEQADRIMRLPQMG